MSTLTKQLQSKEVTTNASQGKYRPFFFDYSGFNISKVIYNSNYFKETSIEQTLLQGTFSFAYLREDKLRTIDAFNESGNHIEFKNFLNHFGIGIKSKNLFKTGKYLSRVFRPVKYGAFFKELDIHVNNNIEYKGSVTDGISLISLELAKSLGWQNAQPAMSAQFTLFYNNGLVKGHCVVSDKIEHDVVVYSKENIKSEITLQNDIQFIGLEPVSLGKSLRIDIQSLLNLWGLFGGEQYLHWAYTGIEKFKKDLLDGKIKDWLDNINDITGEDYENEKWVLRKAIYHNIDYRQFPGLFRAAWTMFKTSMITFAEKSNGSPSFRIPVPGGKRGYLRVDLRDHDIDGNFNSHVNPGEIELDKYGNIWVNPYDTSVTFDTLGGADQDDSAAVIPVENNKAVIFRNPNQLGEYSIMKLINTDVKIENVNKLAGSIPVKMRDTQSPSQSRDFLYRYASR